MTETRTTLDPSRSPVAADTPTTDAPTTDAAPRPSVWRRLAEAVIAGHRSAVPF